MLLLRARHQRQQVRDGVAQLQRLPQNRRIVGAVRRLCVLAPRQPEAAAAVWAVACLRELRFDGCELLLKPLDTAAILQPVQACVWTRSVVTSVRVRLHEIAILLGAARVCCTFHFPE